MSLLLSQDLTANLVLTGNIGNDTLRGSFWHDELDGGKGADSMVGGDGDDRYVVDNKRDKVVEAAGEGRDVVVSSIDYTLSTNLERLIGTGSRDLTLLGNGKGNDIAGSTGDDTIKGLDGRDSLLGGLGKDVLSGGKGVDAFLFHDAALVLQRRYDQGLQPQGRLDLPLGAPPILACWILWRCP